MKLFTKRYHQPGTPPGQLAEPASEHFSITLIDYNAQNIIEQNNVGFESFHAYINNANITWIHIQGDPNHNTLHTLAKALGIHDLYIEDIVNTGQRPKVEMSDEHIFTILSLPVDTNFSVNVEQVSLFLSKNTLVSFCSGNFNPFLGLNARLKNSVGKLRKRNADYLFYNLIDTVVDYGFPMLELYSERIQALEDKLFDSPTKAELNEVHKLRRELLLLRRRLWPQRELTNQILRDDDNMHISAETKLYFRDCHDHVISIMELLETYHEMTSGLMELYMTSVTLKLNDIMKFLTIITTIFIPPTFLVGVYGMNFDPQISNLNMPEIEWKYGYITVWLVIVLMFAGMVTFFRRRKWF